MRIKSILLLACLALLAACAPSPAPAPTGAPGASPTPSPLPTPEACCASATSTPEAKPGGLAPSGSDDKISPTATPAATATPVPSPTPTVSPLLASRSGIQAGNAGQLVQAAQWGLGAITRQQSLRGGKLVLATTSQGLYLYEAGSLMRVAFFAQATQPVLSEDQSLLAYTSPEQIGLYDLANLKPLKAPPVTAGMVVGAFSPDNRLLAVVHSSVEIDVVKLDDQSVIKLARERTASQEPVTDTVAFSPDNQYLMTGESFRVPGAIARNVLLWNLPEQKLLWYQKSTNLSLPRNPFSPDARHFLTLDGVNTRYHETRFGTVLFSAVGMPGSAPFSPDGKLFFLEHKGVVTLYTAGDYPGGLVRVLVPEGPGGNAFSPDSTRFFAGSQVWTIGEWKAQPSGSAPAPQASISPAQAVQLGHYANLKGVAVAQHASGAGKKGEMWAWGSYDNTAYLLELTSGRLQTAGFAGARLIANLAFNPASMRFAACTDLGLEILDMNARSRDSFTPCAPNGLVAFSPDGTRLARAAVTRVEMLDPNNGNLLNTLIEHTTNINYLGFSADSKWLGVGTVKNRENGYTQVSLWQVNPLQLVPGFRGQQIPGGGFNSGVYAMLVSLDGQWMIAQTNMLRAWRIANAEQMKYQETAAEALALSPDGNLVASAGAQGVRLWSVPGLEPLGALPGAGGVLGASFNAGGTGLVTFGADGMLRLWLAP